MKEFLMALIKFFFIWLLMCLFLPGPIVAISCFFLMFMIPLAALEAVLNKQQRIQELREEIEENRKLRNPV